MTVAEIKLAMEGLDKRTTKYKELKAQLELPEASLEDDSLPDIELEEYEEEDVLEEVEKDYYEKKAIEITEENLSIKESNYLVSDEIYNVIDKFYGKVPADRLSWLFTTYNKLFDTKIEKCLCSGKIRKMIIKITKTYEKERR